MAHDLLFILFSSVLLLAAVMVVAARHPVHAVLFLILAFINAAGLFLLLGAEFLALVLIVVYVGAVAVLFLFLVMMLDIPLHDPSLRRHRPVALAIGALLAAQLGTAAWSWSHDAAAIPAKGAEKLFSLGALGRVLYTKDAVAFQMVGMILLVAMIGAIVLTLRRREGVKRQDLDAQIARDPREVLTLTHPPVGGGVNIER